MNPIQPFIDRYGAFVLDGGLATQLEAHGCDLDDPLWSAKILLEKPEIIRQVHAEYLWAGADCIISASYQATIPGFMARGYSENEAERLICTAVELAVEERDAYWNALSIEERSRRLRPLVAVSIGPYAAYLADGSEYTGEYDKDVDELAAFHRRRWHLLSGSKADIMACETIPVKREAIALAHLLAETPKRWAWFSFACRDEQHLNDGTRLQEIARYLIPFKQAAAIGINCTSPKYIPGLIAQVGEVGDKPIIVYPNSGESYDAHKNLWRGSSVPSEFGTFSREWRKLGAGAIGGCCRTTPQHIKQIRDRFPWKISS